MCSNFVVKPKKRQGRLPSCSGFTAANRNDRVALHWRWNPMLAVDHRVPPWWGNAIRGLRRPFGQRFASHLGATWWG